MIRRSVHTSERANSSTLIVILELCLVVVTLASIYVFIGAGPEDFVAGNLRKLTWLNNVVLVTQVLILRKSYGSIAAPMVLYTVFLSLFTSGQLILFSIGIVPTGADVLNREAYSSITRSTSFYLTAFSFFCASAVVVNEFRKRENRPVSSRPAPVVGDWQGAVKVVGIACIAIGFLPFALATFNNLKIVVSQGYSGYYQEGARLDSPLLGVSYLFVTGLVFVGCAGSSSWRKFAIGSLVAVAMVRLGSGDRGEGMIYALTAFLLWSNTGGSAARRRFVLVAVGLSALVAIPAIGVLRHSYGSDVSLRQSVLGDNPVAGTLNNLGITLFPLVKVMELSPGVVDYANGGTYASAVVRILPTPIQAGPIAEIAEDPLLSSPASWLMTKLGMSYGPGFTPFAEAYLNFGWWFGAMAMGLYGAIFSILLRVPDRSLAAWPLRMAMVAGSFALLGFSVRGSSNFIVAFLVRYLLLPGAATVLVARGIQRKRERRFGESVGN